MLERTINIKWSYEDVLSIRDDLTEEQACEVLAEAYHRYDCAEGLNWDVLQYHANHLYPQKISSNMPKIIPTKNEITFFNAYILAIKTSEIGGPYDADLTSEFERDCWVDCLCFYRQIKTHIDVHQIERAASDFWVTRSKADTGFWVKDQSWTDWQMERFDKLAESFDQPEPEFGQWFP